MTHDDRHDAWRARHARAPKRDAEFSTQGGLPLEPCYFPEDVTGPYEDRLGDPGAFPYTRGIHPTMYRGRLWTKRQFAGFGTAADTNRRY